MLSEAEIGTPDPLQKHRNWFVKDEFPKAAADS